MKFKKSTIIDIDKLFIADYVVDYNDEQHVTALVLKRNNSSGNYYDLKHKHLVDADHIYYATPLSKYITTYNSQLSVKTALEISKTYFDKFNKENIGQPKCWEPKVLLKDTIPYLKITNSIEDKTMTK